MESPLEPVLTPEAYRFVVDLVYQHSRIRLGDDKQALLANRLRHRLKDLALSSYKKYCQILESERIDLVKVIPIHKDLIVHANPSRLCDIF